MNAGSSGTPHVVRKGEGRPILLIHGNGVDHRLLLPLEDAFQQDRRWQRIYIDLPGFGQTPALPAPGGAPQFAEWLKDFASRTFGEQPFAIVGSSFGGLLARHLASRLPDQVVGLALLCPVVDPVHAHRSLPQKSIVARDDALLNELPTNDRELFEDVAVLQTRESWERFREYVLPGLRNADEAATARLAANYELGCVPESVGQSFDGATLVITGRQDHIVGYEDQIRLSTEHYPRATLAVLDGVGHNAHLEAPELVNSLLLNWLQRFS